ncbi:PA4780 family RIO1-like protein kinase [Aureliella helgolandensis]|uniref:non-specific serine/threonine protein kinase n=1 Tax=Aureliella helgolandensis TaxID=2527968 RepID=A0A518G7G5_9BACT|nr:PA4780 family RIO1-like protein kinase [Aureliella helgolandensis]QDV24524.1 RIO1 family protein [Aureliella helgolandensis]
MKVGKRLQPLIEDGLIDKVLGSLMSGKEAQVFLVRCGDETRCAKVYKDVAQRSFKNAVQYQEDRKIRNSRRQRAIDNRSKFGRDEQEIVWQRAEVDALYKLAEAGVRVPKAYGLFDGVLLMELITDGDGGVAPRLNDITMSAEQAVKDHATVMTYVLRMLCAGLVHGDLSEFNVLQDATGPVIIDFPQVVNASGNNNAKTMLQRDVRTITQYYAQFAPELAETHYAEEMWDLHEKSELTADMELTGQFEFSTKAADVESVLNMIDLAYEEELERQDRMENG